MRSSGWAILFLLLISYSLSAEEIRFVVQPLDDHSAGLTWSGTSASWEIARKESDRFHALVTLDSAAHMWMDTTLRTDVLYVYRLLPAESDSLPVVLYDSVITHLSAPLISGIEPLTDESALLWWDSIDAAADEVQLLITDLSWSRPEHKERVAARQGWIIIKDLQPLRPYRVSLLAVTPHNTSAPCPEYLYTHQQPLLDWAFVPAATFEMGGKSDDEAPPHTVQLSPYLLSCSEITNRDYLTYCTADSAPYPEDPHFPGMKDYIYRHPNYPVVNVSWHEATAYCNWLARAMKLSPSSVRLPTEAEWEHAARLLKGKYPWGTLEPSKNVACYADGDRKTPVAVRSYTATPNGLYDLAGNVWEWCLDWYGPYHAAVSVDPLGSAGGMFKVVRGGSWSDPADALKSTSRGKLSPDVGLSTVGFRVARAMPIPPVKVINLSLTGSDDAVSK